MTELIFVLTEGDLRTTLAVIAEKRARHPDTAYALHIFAEVQDNGGEVEIQRVRTGIRYFTKEEMASVLTAGLAAGVE